MFYKFPYIEHIDQVKEAIEGKPEFIVAEREHFDIVNYMVSTQDTFPPLLEECGKLTPNYKNKLFPVDDAERFAILRECRGIVFDKKGNILSRRFHKFFNLDERQETMLGNLKRFGVIHTEHDYMQKLDGSMITPIYIEALDGFRWGTKMGLSDVALHAEAFVADKPVYTQFARFCHDLGLTPIFEYCSRYNRIVIDHPVEKMVLLAVRDTRAGTYMSYQGMVDVINHSFQGIPVVYLAGGPTIAGSLETWVKSVPGRTGEEGVIIRFENGHMLKVKTEWYVQIHKAKDNLLHEKNVIQMLLDETTDDVKPFLQEDDLQRLNDFEANFWMGVYLSTNLIIKVYDSFLKDQPDRKTFAERVNTVDMPNIKPILFRLFRCVGIQELAREQVLKMIRNNLTSQTKVDSVRNLFGAKWNYYSE